MNIFSSIAVIGAGAWGTAIATSCARASGNVMLWALEEEVANSINQHHENALFLAGITLPKTIKATNDLKDVSNCDIIFLVSPAQFVRSTCQALLEAGLAPSASIVLCSKGIEKNTALLMSEVVQETLPHNPLAVLSGPTFAKEVAQNLPAAATLACEDKTLATHIAKHIAHAQFHIDFSTDIIGAEIAGAMKNVIAIACGIVAGKGLGENAKAALITSAMNEIRLVNHAKGGRLKTLIKLCGIGDLILTCTSTQSRNMSLGYALGQGQTMQTILAERNSIAEGVASAASVLQLAEKLNLTLPVCQAVHDVVNEHIDIDAAITKLTEF